MEYTWWMFSFACLVFTKCLSGASAAAVNIDFYSSSSQPSDVNIYNLQKHVQVSAHLGALPLGIVRYPTDTVIKDWSTSDPLSHLKCGMTYEDGKLKVPETGRYYIYAQLQFRGDGRAQIQVNDAFVTLITSPKINAGANSNGMGVFELKAGDTISVRIVKEMAPPSGKVELSMKSDRTYFGAFLI